MPKLDISKVAPERILGNRHPHLVEEWHPTKNGELTPFDVTHREGKEVWWLCSKCSHEWVEKIFRRSNGKRCPNCKIGSVKVGNSLGEKCPILVKEWHTIKNGALTPYDFPFKSNKKAWWICSKCKYEWEAKICNRSNGTGCPSCSGKVVTESNNLGFNYPELAKEWHPTKNGDITPYGVTCLKNDKAWWLCSKCGHEWKTAISSRSMGSGCPLCYKNLPIECNNLELKYPHLAKEWHPTKNGKLTPKQVTSSKNLKVWWTCFTCSHEWESTIVNRTKGVGCPKCSGRVANSTNNLAVHHPDLIKEWHPTKNELKPEQVKSGSGKKVWWICSKCSHEWKSRVVDRSKGRGCPKCAEILRISFPEKATAFYFAQAIDIIEQYKLPNSNRSLDIFIPSLNVGIEYDGEAWHQDAKKDKKKDELCNKLDIVLYRIRENGCVRIEDSSSIIYEIAQGSNKELEEVIKKLIYTLTFKQIEVNIDNDRIKIEELLLKEYENNSLQNKCPTLCEEWHPSKNGKLLPKNFRWKSKKKVWWKCSTCSHEWEAVIGLRVKGNGCPACAGKIPAKSKNNLKKKHPKLVEEWHPTKNKLTPEQVTSGSNKKACWKCSKCSHEWEALIYSRAKGYGCPECAKKKRVETFRKNKLLKEQASNSSLQSS